MLTPAKPKPYQLNTINPIYSIINPWCTDLFNLNFQSLDVVSRYRDTQLQVTENLGDLLNLGPNIY